MKCTIRNLSVLPIHRPIPISYSIYTRQYPLCSLDCKLEGEGGGAQPLYLPLPYGNFSKSGDSNLEV